MIEKDEGVVLKSTRSGETSKVITFFGRRSGKIRLLGKGAMTARNPLRAALEPGNIIETVFYHKQGRTLYFLKEADVVLSAGSGRDLVHAATSLALLELVNQVCYWASPEERVIDLLVEYRKCEPPRDALFLFIAFEFKLLQILGALPDFSWCSSCGVRFDKGYFHPEDGVGACNVHTHPDPHRIPLGAATLPFLEQLTRRPLDSLDSLEVDGRTRKKLGKILHWTYTFHVQGYGLPEALKLIPKS